MWRLSRESVNSGVILLNWPSTEINFRNAMYVDNSQIAEPIALNAWCAGRIVFIELTGG
jgi:hypothetical protein